MTAEGQCYFSD